MNQGCCRNSGSLIRAWAAGGLFWFGSVGRGQELFVLAGGRSAFQNLHDRRDAGAFEPNKQVDVFGHEHIGLSSKLYFVWISKRIARKRSRSCGLPRSRCRRKQLAVMK